MGHRVQPGQSLPAIQSRQAHASPASLGQGRRGFGAWGLERQPQGPGAASTLLYLRSHFVTRHLQVILLYHDPFCWPGRCRESLGQTFSNTYLTYGWLLVALTEHRHAAPPTSLASNYLYDSRPPFPILLSSICYCYPLLDARSAGWFSYEQVTCLTPNKGFDAATFPTVEEEEEGIEQVRTPFGGNFDKGRVPAEHAPQGTSPP